MSGDNDCRFTRMPECGDPVNEALLKCDEEAGEAKKDDAAEGGKGGEGGEGGGEGKESADAGGGGDGGEEPKKWFNPCSSDPFQGGDPQQMFRDECRLKKCSSYMRELETCNERVTSREKTEEKCVEEVIDLFHCVDNCAAKRFFKYLK